MDSRPRARATTRHHLLAVCPLLLGLGLAPAGLAGEAPTATFGSYQLLATDRPPQRTDGPVSVPLKAMVERLAFGSRGTNPRTRNFRYDIDSLGRGLAVRLKFRF